MILDDTGMWRFISGLVFPDVSKEHIAFIFKGWEITRDTVSQTQLSLMSSVSTLKSNGGPLMNAVTSLNAQKMGKFIDLWASIGFLKISPVISNLILLLLSYTGHVWTKLSFLKFWVNLMHFIAC
jgi:hypothetical protein